MNAVTPTDYTGGSPFYDVFNKGINEMSDFFANAGIPGIGNGEPTIPPPQVKMVSFKRPLKTFPVHSGPYG